jgi:lipoprotein-releasing system permease protein
VSYTLEIGFRYLRSKKRATVSAITFIAVTGVALGVAALLAVMSIASGFQQEFRDKVLGVNAHVLVMKYGLDFQEYRAVVARARKMPEVKGAAPFFIAEMMLAKGDRLSGVLVKGVDPELMLSVLDLPDQIVSGSLEGMRRPDAAPAVHPEDLERERTQGEEQDLDAYLESLAREHDLESVKPYAGKKARPSDSPPTKPAAPAKPAAPPEALPQVKVPTPEQVEAALKKVDLGDLPSDEYEQALFDQLAAEKEQALGETRQLPGIAVGKTLAENLDIRVGEQVRIISPLSGLDTSAWRPGAVSPRSRDFRVIAVFQAGFQEYDTRLVFIDLYEAQAFYDLGDTVTGVEVTLHDIDRAAAVAATLERKLGGTPYHTLDWKDLNHNLFTALKIQKVMLSLVITTIILVAAFNVIATLIIIVLEKRREIAILKAMGATDAGVMGIFLVQGTAIGLLGTLIGLAVGAATCAYLSAYEFPLDPKVYLIDHLPLRVSAWEFSLTALIALCISVAATLVPSWWAARLLPAEGIRYQQ